MKLIKSLMLIILKLFFSLFYDKEKLCGRWFDSCLIGYKWAFRGLLWQKVFGQNRKVPWPCAPTVTIGGNPNNIIFSSDNIDNFWGGGIYYQCYLAKIYIGAGTYIANNVGLITNNHNIYDPDKSEEGKDIINRKKMLDWYEFYYFTGSNIR